MCYVLPQTHINHININYMNKLYYNALMLFVFISVQTRVDKTLLHHSVVLLYTIILLYTNNLFTRRLQDIINLFVLNFREIIPITDLYSVKRDDFGLVKFENNWKIM